MKLTTCGDMRSIVKYEPIHTSIWVGTYIHRSTDYHINLIK